MPARRTTSDEERELFEAALGDTVRPGQKPKRRPKESRDTEVPKPAVSNKIEQRKAAAPRRNTGIDGNTADRLRRGLIEPQARLDLHGLTLRDAHRALVTFLRGAHARKLRLVLVVTGKGSDARATHREQFDLELDMSRRGVLRTMTPRWLKEAGLAELVVHVGESNRRHGGSGALYVYLRKHP